ncbi:MAG: MBOAT family O-acyltransferase [Bacteroidota bacterium]
MDFTSVEYLFFLLIVVGVFYQIKPGYRQWFLVLAGYLFYAFYQWQYCILLFGMSLYTYYAAIWLSNNQSNKLAFSLCILVLFTPLFFFKFNNFFIDEVKNLSGKASIISYAFPIGLSFFSFQMVSYLVDIRRKYLKPEQNIVKILLHHAFFPILLAGPIERAKKLITQFEFRNDFDYTNFRDALFQILWGIFKKIVIANNLAFYVNTIYSNLSRSNGMEVLLAMWFFVFQIIVDFSAYNDIAMGSAKLFGITITKNIHDRAYASTSRTQLWQRWHVSLTSWLRDYIFFPLSKFSKKRGWLYCNMLIIYLISGLWHGASWGFILWGLGNGIWLIGEQITKKSRFIFFERIGLVKYPRLFNFGAWLIFLNASAFFDVFFLSKNWDEINGKFSQLFAVQPFGFMAGKRVILLSILSILFLELANRYKNEREIYELLPKSIAKRWFVYFVLFLALFYFRPVEDVSFLYFKF